MGIGVSIFLLAVGAILAYAVDVSVSGLDLDTIGVILMIDGAIGLIASLLIFGRSGFGGRPVTETYVEDGPAGRRTVDY